METADIVDPGASGFQFGTVPQFTQWYTHTLETLIRQNPDQYWWLHRRWKGDPADRKRHREACRNPQAA
jgi:KDO2-lipid IV(A) lauroyltransferase